MRHGADAAGSVTKLSGFECASSINSFTEVTGSDKGTVSSRLFVARIVTGANARTLSYGMLLIRAGLTVLGPVAPISSVCPSGGDFATISAEIVPPAPLRLSTTTG